MAPETIARLGLSMVPEGRHVFTQLTVEENILLGSQMRRDRKQVRADFERMLESFPFLRGRLSTPGGKLSGGEQQQLVIARALMTSPRLILLDEPSLGLAPMVVDTVYEILKGLRDEGITLLVVEQSTHRALENGDRIYIIRSGLRSSSKATAASLPTSASSRPTSASRRRTPTRIAARASEHRGRIAR